ncbi:two-component regulator propeller domain-containing protein, partial [Calditrichota bacterium]
MAKCNNIFFLLVFFSGFVLAQNDTYKFKRYNVDDGLSGPFLRCAIQDQKGFMWFGTESGLNKFDGYKFTVYAKDPNDSTSLSNNSVFALHEDTLGNIWIGTIGGGLNIFDRKTERFKIFKYNPDDPKTICSNFINTIYQDNQGNIWLGTENGLSQVNVTYINSLPVIKEFKNYIPDPANPYSLNSKSITALCEDKKKMIWIATESNGLNIFDSESGRFINKSNFNIINDLDLPLNIELLWSSQITDFYPDPLDIQFLWIGTKKGIFIYDNIQNSINIFAENIHTSPGSLYKSDNNILWAGSRNSGLYLYDNNKKLLRNINRDLANPLALSDNWIKIICPDNNGGIWIGTSGGGINLYSKKRYKFEHIILNTPENKQYSGVTSIFEDITENRNILWIGTGLHGILKYNRKSGEIKAYKFGEKEYVYSIYQHRDEPDYLWLGTRENGLLKFDKKSENFIQYIYYNDKNENLNSIWIKNIIEDQSGCLWLTSKNGLYRFNKLTAEFTPYCNDPDDSNTISDNHTTFINQDNSGKFWIGTYMNGLNTFDPYIQKFNHYLFNEHDSTSISDNKINSIYQSSNGILWIGTPNGLNKFIPENETFKRYQRKDGLYGIDVMGILEDDHGNLWLSTNNCLTKFNPTTEKFRHYFVSDGLQSHDFLKEAFHKSKSGEMFFGGAKGFNAFYPDSIKDNLNIPPVYLTDFQLFNKTVKPGKYSPLNTTISEAKEIMLNYDQSVFSIEFSALDFTIPEKNHYAYKMDGVDPDWVYTDASRRFATYTQLNPGEYIFRVKGTNNDGIWNEEGTSVKIIIIPPWWRTNFAYALYIIFVGMIIWLTFRFQSNRLKMKQQLEMEHLHAEKLEEVDHLKSQFFANISHEFRTPLTLILGPVRLMISGEFKGNFKEQYKIIMRNAERLLHLINQLLDLSKLESGKLKLEAQATDIIKLTNGLVQAFESLAVRKEITLEFNTELKSQEVYIDLDKFEKIINNLLSNAFKFTPEGGKVSVGVMYMHPPQSPLNRGEAMISPFGKGDKGGCLQISISNTGQGIPDDQIDKIFDRFYQVNNSYAKDGEGTGIGLALTKELVELHHGKISVESDLDYKTTFIVLLPLGKEHLRENEIIKETESEDRAPETEKQILPEAEIIGIQSESSSRSPVSNLQSPMILIVEDNADLRNYIRSNVEDSYQILEAENGKEGWEMATKEIPDLIISDVMMPEMDGFELCKKLKQDERTSHIPIILLTARAAREDKIEGLETGADDFIPKPFDAEELQIRIKNLINQRKKLREQFSKQNNLVFDQIIPTSADEKFITRIMDIISQHISDSNFNLESLSNEAGMSQMHLYRKIKGLFGLSPAEFVKTIRLKQAAEMLKVKTGNISEVAYEVGFDS